MGDSPIDEYEQQRADIKVGYKKCSYCGIVVHMLGRPIIVQNTDSTLICTDCIEKQAKEER